MVYVLNFQIFRESQSRLRKTTLQEIFVNLVSFRFVVFVSDVVVGHVDQDVAKSGQMIRTDLASLGKVSRRAFDRGLKRMAIQSRPECHCARIEVPTPCRTRVIEQPEVFRHSVDNNTIQGLQPLLTQITEEQIAQAMDAASAVGDDHIQRQAQGYVAPESWTHGSSAQRQQSLMVGLRSGDLASCEIR